MPDLAPSARTTPRSELGELLHLAAPLIAGYAGNQLMSLVDTAMVGRLGPTALGGVAIANGIFFTLTLVGMGCVIGMDPLVAQAVGAGEHRHARRILHRGLWLALALSFPLMALMALTPLALEPLGIDPETAASATHYLLGRLPNTIPFLLFAAARSYLQAVGATRPVVISMVAANIVNFVANAILIYGDGALAWVDLPPIGLPPLGVLGAGLASSVSSVISVIVVALGVRSIAVSAAGAAEDHPIPTDPAITRSILRIGLPIGGQLFAEVGAFALAGFLTGTIGALPIAGHQVAITLASFSFTVTLGLSAATSVRVGHAVGRGDTAGARRAGFLGLSMGAGFMTLSAFAFVLAPATLARILTDKPDVIAAAAPLVMIAAVFQISDGLQVVAAGAVRGAGDSRSALLWNAFGHYVIGIPVAIALGFGANMGARGIWWGLSAGLTVVAIGLTLRFHRISSRTLRRVGEDPA